jgi:hypothetical protein
MAHRNRRFRCRREASGTWMVWDDETSAPAVLGGSVLQGRSEGRARVACDILERIYRNQLDARSMKTAGPPKIDVKAARWTEKARSA